MLLGFVETLLLTLILSVLALWCELEDSHCSQEAEDQIVFGVRSYKRVVVKTVSLNSQQNRFHQRFQSFRDLAEFKSKSVGQIRKLLGYINEINLANSLSPARR